MRLVMDTPKFAVYDDVLPEEEFKKLWLYVQNDMYAYPHTQQWMKVWRLNDGTPVGSRDYKYTERPFNNPIDIISDAVEKVVPNHDFVKPWDELHIRSYLYPRNTKLSWHNDSGYEGAFIFYTHPRWASTWGGELMIHEVPEELPKWHHGDETTKPHLDHRWEDAVLEAYGMGNYITAKPNRLVITGKNVWHAVNRVDADAGDNSRCSVVGFYKKYPEEIQELEDLHEEVREVDKKYLPVKNIEIETVDPIQAMKAINTIKL